MRLTLRTLLAYLNETGLNSTDRKQVQERIEKSENAQSLIRHLKSISSDPGISVWAPLECDGFRNPNRVAGYLDSTMQDKLVEQFEKTALDSGQLLAEIAFGHAVLAKILRQEHVKVPIGLRQKIYSLTPVQGEIEGFDGDEFADEYPARVPTIKPDLPTPHPKNGQADKKQKPSARESRKKIEEKAESKEPQFECGEPNHGGKHSDIPSKSSEHPWYATAIIALAVLLIGSGIGIGYLIALGGNQSALKEVGGKLAQDDSSNNSKDVELNNKQKQNAQAEKTYENQKATDSSDQPKNPTGGQPTDSKGDSDSKTKIGEPKKDKSVRKDASSEPAKDKSKPGEGNPGAKKVTGSDQKGDPDGDSKATDNSKPVAKNVPKAIATWARPKQLVAGLDAESGNWMVLDRDNKILANRWFKNFRGFPVRYTIDAIGEIEIRKSAEYRFLPPRDEQQMLGIEMRQGILRLQLNETSVHLIAGKKSLQLRTNRPDSVIWVRLVRFSPNRKLGDVNDRGELLQVHVEKGQATVQLQGKQVELSVTEACELMTGQEMRAGSLKVVEPDWTRPVDNWVFEYGVEKILGELKSGRALEAQLTKMTDDIRAEVVIVSTQMLSSLGYYQPLIQLLDHESKSTAWSQSINYFRQDLANQPRLVQRVTESLGNAEDAEQQTLGLMLLGVNNEELKKGADAAFVAQLDSQSLARRVLAIENLTQITTRSFLYRPESSKRFRTSKVRRWKRDMLEKGKIRFEKPAPVFPRLFEFRKLKPLVGGELSPLKQPPRAEPGKQKSEQTGDRKTDSAK